MILQHRHFKNIPVSQRNYSHCSSPAWFIHLLYASNTALCPRWHCFLLVKWPFWAKPIYFPPRFWVSWKMKINISYPSFWKSSFRWKLETKLILKQSLLYSFLTETRLYIVQAVTFEVLGKSVGDRRDVTKLSYDLSSINIHLVNTCLWSFSLGSNTVTSGIQL